jgi:hypothetical protein
MPDVEEPFTPATPPAAPARGEPEPMVPAGGLGPAPKKRRFFLVPQLFLFPLVIVSVMVLIYVFFAAASEESRTVGQLIGDLKVEGLLNRQASSRSAYALALLASDMERTGRRLDENETRQLIDVLDHSKENPAIHQYVVLALGRIGREELAFPILLGVLADPRRGQGARIEAVRGLCLSRSPRAAPPLLGALRAARREEEFELRASILQALTNIAGPPGRPSPAGQPPAGAELRAEIAAALKDALKDPSPLVSRNAAMWLADTFRDPAGVSTLRLLLDWDHLAAQPLSFEEEEVMICRAIECLARLGDQESIPAIRAHAAGSRSYKVKNAALRALRDGLDTTAGPPVQSPVAG